MASAIMRLNTLAWAKRLESAGIPTSHAEAHVELLSTVIADNICTKQDLNDFEKKIEIKLKELELKTVESKNELIKWFIGSFIVASSITVTIIKIFF
jgi:hypothetical protein